jgi:hypothetical protein
VRIPGRSDRLILIDWVIIGRHLQKFLGFSGSTIALLLIVSNFFFINSAQAAAPTVSNMTFTGDSVLGGTLDTITGTNLAGAISVTVGGVAATLGNNTSTSLEFYIPAGTVGTQSVVVTTSGGVVTSTFSITYYTTLTPACGVSGYFTIDKNNTVISNSACKGLATIPSGVKTIGGTSFQNNANLFSVSIPSTVTTIATSGGWGPFRSSYVTEISFQANSQLTVIPSGAFRQLPYLQYMSIPTSVTQLQSLAFADYIPTNGLRWVEIPDSVTRIDTATTYGAISNEVPLTCVISPVGSVARTLEGKFTRGNGSVTTVGAANPIFVTSVMDCPSPTISSFSVTQGSANGGVSLTIYGTNMWNVNSVTIGGAQAQITSFPSASSVTVLTPAGSLGAQNVVVSTPGPSATSTGGYTYLPPPTITGVSVTSSPLAGGGTTVVTGTNLGSLSASTIGATAATRASNTSTSVTLTIPAGTVGTKDIVLTNVNGTVTASGAFTYYEITSSFSVFSVAGSVNTVSIRAPLTITATVAYASKITFKYGGTRIAGCISKATPASAPFTVTCTWKPTRKGVGLLTATSVPVAGGISTGYATPISMTVGGRSNTR